MEIGIAFVQLLVSLPMASLQSVEYKIFHAAQHIRYLEPELLKYFESNPGKMVQVPATSNDEAFFTFQPQASIPARFGLIIGDCLQNLRSSLDYLIWELVLAAKRTPGPHNMFPICESPEKFGQAVKRRRLLGLDSAAIEMIEGLQPYHLCGDYDKSILWALDELTNINKHRKILLTNLMAGKAHRENLLRVDGEVWYHTGPGPTPVFDSETQFGPFPIVEGQLRMDIQLIAVMTFGEGAAKGLEVSLCLSEWTRYIKEDIIPKFEKCFDS